MSARENLFGFVEAGAEEEDLPAFAVAIDAFRAEAVAEAADALVTNFDWPPADRPTVEAVRNALRLMARGALPASPAAPAADSTGGESAEDAAVRRSVDSQFPIVAAFLAEGAGDEGGLERLRKELAAYKDELDSLQRNTLPQLRREIQHHQDGKRRWRVRAETAEPQRDELRRERDALQQRLHEAAMAKVWTNEDGKKFVFVDDLTGPLLGITPKAGERS